MNKKLLFIFITFITIAFAFVSTVEAKRFGGGGSFGGKKSYSSPFKQSGAQKKSFSQQKAATTNQQRKQQLSSRGGLMGMLGGLALGGLLGAMFFGGAFEGFNFFDFLMIGGVIFAVFWFMKRKKPSPHAQSTAPGAPGGFDMKMDGPPDTRSEAKNTSLNPPGYDADKRDAGFTDSFDAGQSSSSAQFKENKEPDSNKNVSFAESFGMGTGNTENDTNPSQLNSQSNETVLPDWFNEEEFLSGARSAYTLLQEAWDNSDLESIRELTTDKVYAEISKQHAEESSQGATRILKLNAELIDFNELDEQSEAAVVFNALLGETDSQGNQERADQVKELWHFIRANNSSEPTWYLDGIQQLE